MVVNITRNQFSVTAELSDGSGILIILALCLYLLYFPDSSILQRR